MHPDLPKLLDVQARDRHLAELTAQMREIDTEVAGLDAALDRVRADIASTTRLSDEAARRRDELETKIEAGRQHQDRRRERLEFVRNPREAATLMGDIEVARGILAQEESDWVRISEEATDRTTAVRSTTERLAAMEQDQAEGREGLASRSAVLKSELDTERAEREHLASQVDRTLRLRYDRLRGSRKTEVLVPAMKATCTACHTSIPSSRVGRLEAEGMLLDGCEMCGAIIYFVEVPA
ncbi:MAG: hypothetical protein H0W15_06420 [Gemmatimonadales bacterium]|nr:hypothetical protein [Gemmatimonadales bacterium]